VAAVKIGRGLCETGAADWDVDIEMATLDEALDDFL
jgi:hypothetical protein